ncbi:MAG: vanadium-dependent haloperoxidase [Rhodobacteraceae bacterium]|nr:vanadium-dependent haloperoxidase [Paracoccaceae bacterium]
MPLTHRINRRALLGAAAMPLLLSLPRPALAAPDGAAVLADWYRLVLELVRHTATYSPPVASRSFAYLGITLHEALVGGPGGLVSLAGQVQGLTPPPAAPKGLDAAFVLQGAFTTAVPALFSRTGPTGQRAMAAMAAQQDKVLSGGADAATEAASRAHGAAIAAHILAWAETDGGAEIENMGFPMEAAKDKLPSQWVPTSKVAVQQAPLLPYWGTVRTFVLSSGADCGLPPPPDYSEEPGSAFYNEAKEVYDTSRSLTDEQKLIARFWSDDPMLSSTPPGHWISIVLEIFARDVTPIDRQAEVLALLGIAVADAFIACWDAKFKFDLIRPLTYIRRVIDPKWEPLLNTPPFPEYPSGHSTQSGAAAGVLTALFGEGFAFEDGAHADDGLPVRPFTSFAEAANEAAISRLYGGIHFRAAIEQGLAQGACIAAKVAQLKTREA